MRRILTRARDWLQSRHGPTFFMTLALISGVLVGLAASLLILIVDAIRELTAQTEGWGRIAPVVTVPLGLLVAWWLARTFAPEVEGGGVTRVTEALAVRAGRVSARVAPFKALATGATLGAGGSAGREGPIVHIGASIGSAIARYSGLGEDRIRSLVAAGAGAGIGASFNAPIAGMLFAMEVLLGNFAIRHLHVVVVTSVAAAVTTRTLVGEERILRAVPHSLGDPRDLLAYVLLGVLAAVIAFLFLKFFDRVEGIAHEWRLPAWLRPVSAGLIVGAIGVAEPDVLGTGQEFISGLVRSSTVEDVWWLFVVLALLKVVTAGLTLVSGGSGGEFMPSLFVGATLGTGLAAGLQQFWPELNTAAFAVVGMAAVFAAVARAPLTSIIIVFEITGDYGLVLPLMLAASIATVLAERWHRDSIYHLPLKRLGIRIVRSGEVDLLDTVAVHQVMSTSLPVLATDTTTGEAQGIFDRTHHHGLAVCDDGRVVGILTVTDIARSGGPSDDPVRDVMTPRPVTVSPRTPVSIAIERMAALGVGRLPVVGDDDSVYVGMFRRDAAVNAYHLALSATTDHELARSRLRVRSDPGTGFTDYEVPVGSFVDGRPLREVDWPRGATVVSVRRGRTVMIPSGDTVLEAGDLMTVFGSPESHAALATRLSYTAR